MKLYITENSTIKGGVHQSVNYVIETRSGGFFIIGKIDMYRTTGMDALIIKTDASGNELWNRTAGGDGDQLLYSVAPTIDGGLVLAGSERNETMDGHSRLWIMKVGIMDGDITTQAIKDRSEHADNITRTDAISTEKNQSNEPSFYKEPTQKFISSFRLLDALISVGILFLIKRNRI